MSLISNPSDKYYLVLATSIISFLFLFIQFFFGFFPEKFIGLPVQHIFSATLLTFFISGLAFSAFLLTKKIKNKKADKLLNYPLLLSMILLPFIALPFLILKAGITADPEFFIVIDGLAFFCAVSFAVYTFFNMGMLFLRKAAPIANNIWKILLILLAAGNIFNFFTYPVLHPVSIIFISIIACAVIALIFYFRGFADLSVGEKAKASFKFLMTGAAATIIYFLVYQYQHQDLFPVNNLLVISIFGSVLLFAVLGALVAMISIPVAVFRNKEHLLLKDIQKIHNNKHNNNNQKNALQEIFRSCLKTSGAKGGAVIYSPTEASVAEQVFDQASIDDKDLKRILFSIVYNKEHFLIYNESEHIYISDIKKHPILQNHDLPFQSMLIYMVQVKQNAFAKIILLSSQKDGFTAQQIEYTSLLVQQAQLSFNNNMIFKDSLEAERFKKDMEIGKNLQKRLLPEYFPENGSFEVAAVSIAAEEVGGDYYDFYQFTDGSYSFIIADVSGKGTPAAFHVAEMKGIFQSLSLSKISPLEFVKKSNKAVSQCFDRGMFITLIHLVVDVNKKVIKYSRAGHCPILHFNYKKGTINYMEDDGLGLGILRNNSFNKMASEHEMSYDSGDIIVLYTDGLVEAKSKKLSEEYGFERLKDVVIMNSIEKPDLILKKVVKDVQDFAEFDLSRDDVSILVLKMK